MNFLYLSEEDMIHAGVLDMHACIDSMEYTFRLLRDGDYRLGGNNDSHGLRTRFPKKSEISGMPKDAPGRWFTAMPAYLGGKYGVFGFKTYGANQDNGRKNLPRSILMMQLLDVDTGMPLAYMSANILSAMRTGAVSGLFARYFADPHAKKVAVIGPGVIGRYSLDAVMDVCSEIESISIFGRGEKSRAVFKEHCIAHHYPMEHYQDCRSIREACADADVVITATTQASVYSEYPLIEAGCLKPGACVIVTSAVCIDRSYCNSRISTFAADIREMYAGNRGLDAAPSESEAKVSVTVKNHLFEMLSSNETVLNLPDVVSDGNYRRDPNVIAFCASGGIPVEDVAWGCECYRNALKKGIGTSLKLWDESKL